MWAAIRVACIAYIFLFGSEYGRVKKLQMLLEDDTLDLDDDWKRARSQIILESFPENSPREFFQKSNQITDGPTALYGRWLAVYGKNIDLVERVAAATDAELSSYILEAVTKDRSFKFLDAVRHIPCCKDVYYDRYRKFFYLLSKEKTY